MGASPTTGLGQPGYLCEVGLCVEREPGVFKTWMCRARATSHLPGELVWLMGERSYWGWLLPNDLLSLLVVPQKTSGKVVAAGGL